MSKINDGGPAFPREDYQTNGGLGQQGMTLRDYFAAKAMQALIMMSHAEWCLFSESNSVSEEAYAQADAMMEARNK